MSATQAKRTVALIGGEFSGGQPKGGVERAPKMMRQAKIVDQVKALGYEVNDCGDHAFPSPDAANSSADPPAGIVKNPRTVGNACKQIYDIVQAAVKRDEIVYTIGGDHSLGLATVGGHAASRPNLCCIWVDAHADINTAETTGSGNMHGMPVSILLGLQKPQDIPGFEWFNPVMTTADIVYIGLRDLDEGERSIIRKFGMKAFTMHHVDKYGIGQVVQMALDHVNPKRDRPIHLSFDVDALDPAIAPSTGTTVRGGLTFREGHYICEAVYETGLLRGLDIMEVNPALGNDKEVADTIAIGCSLTRCALGETLL
ncbi:arginase [Capsaspora owczarzaki ATCC 30864]|uniref:Arginase n=1 Tax=Capsaspora owczarzaki (strain ATCC 30864) TaxID=595528 RepID=A0A0D2X3Q5_CAPO3|nr:arginase [Capsaspora owczarzaki ATCC 30864]KJE94719.1 arginase [Capsaspora owczarzaki ATCC 30864]|eukprot:XP_004347001.1 arginase [Capsaspora owczarzaki ATCC 30864]